jgi:hypothetical protein
MTVLFASAWCHFGGFTNPLYLMELAEHFISFEAKGVSVGPNP